MTMSIIQSPQIYLFIFQLFITSIFQFPHTFSINFYSSLLIHRSITFYLQIIFFIFLLLLLSFEYRLVTYIDI
jgi:hypothetical protein